MSRTGCILVENADQIAPLELTQKVSEQGLLVHGMAYAAEGSFEVLPDKAVEPLEANEYYSLRSELKKLGKGVSWWTEKGILDEDVQPFTLLTNEADKPVVVMFAEGNFSPLAKAKDPHTDEYRLHLEVKNLIKEYVIQFDGDTGKVLAAMQGSNFGKLLDPFSIGRAVITFLAGDGTIFSRVKGNDHGLEADWGSVSNAYGWRPASAGPAEDKSLLGPAARLRAMAAAKGSVKAVSTETNPTKMKTENVLKFSASTEAIAAAAPTSGGTDQDTVSGESAEPEGKPQSGVIGNDGQLYPPNGWASLPKNKQNSKMIQRWYRRNNIGRCPLDWEEDWKKRNVLPGIKANQEPWYSEHEMKQMEENRKRNQTPSAPSQGTYKSFNQAGAAAQATVTAAAKGGTSHLVKPDSPEAKAVMARANDPKYDTAFIEKMAKEWLSKMPDPVIKALSFDDTVMITPDDINKLDRPKASPLSVFGFKSYSNIRWDQSVTDSLIEKCVAEKNIRFISEIIHDLIYRNCVLENDKLSKQVVSSDTTEKPLMGIAARIKQGLGAA